MPKTQIIDEMVPCQDENQVKVYQFASPSKKFDFERIEADVKAKKRNNSTLIDTFKNFAFLIAGVVSGFTLAVEMFSSNYTW